MSQISYYLTLSYMFVGKIPLGWWVITALLDNIFSIHVPPPAASANNNQLECNDSKRFLYGGI